MPGLYPLCRYVSKYSTVPCYKIRRANQKQPAATPLSPKSDHASGCRGYRCVHVSPGDQCDLRAHSSPLAAPPSPSPENLTLAPLDKDIQMLMQIYTPYYTDCGHRISWLPHGFGLIRVGLTCNAH
eukprot:scaffold500299_cov15-Prasinocladus_malaysianus.AAC.1